jgi:hypothetical protein
VLGRLSNHRPPLRFLWPDRKGLDYAADSGGTQFNFSEIVGDPMAVAISSAYDPEGRDVTSAVSKLGSQISANILKEFWPDLRRKFSRDRKATGSSQPASLGHR